MGKSLPLTIGLIVFIVIVCGAVYVAIQAADARVPDIQKVVSQ